MPDGGIPQPKIPSYSSSSAQWIRLAEEAFVDDKTRSSSSANLNKSNDVGTATMGPVERESDDGCEVILRDIEVCLKLVGFVVAEYALVLKQGEKRQSVGNEISF